MSGLITSQQVQTIYSMSHAKVKRLVRTWGIPYDTNSGGYIFNRKEFDESYASKKFKTVGAKTAAKTRKKNKNLKDEAEALEKEAKKTKAK